MTQTTEIEQLRNERDTLRDVIEQAREACAKGASLMAIAVILDAGLATPKTPR